MKPDPSYGLAEDALVALQLRVARRADELARLRKTEASLNLHCWLLAEAEVLGGVPDRRPARDSVSPAPPRRTDH